MQRDFRFGRRVQKAENLDEYLDSSKDERRFGNYLTASALRRGYRCFRGDVDRADILGKKGPQQVVAPRRVE